MPAIDIEVNVTGMAESEAHEMLRKIRSALMSGTQGTIRYFEIDPVSGGNQESVFITAANEHLNQNFRDNLEENILDRIISESWDYEVLVH